MKQLIETYCQVAFLESFFNSIPATSFIEIILDDVDDISTFQNLINIIYNKAAISVDDINHISLLAKEGNPFFIKLIKNSNSGNTKLIDYSSDFNELMSNIKSAIATPLDSVHMYADHKAVLINSFSGWCTLTLENWKLPITSLSINKTLKVDKKSSLNQFPGWQLLKEINLPINAAIIADNFILDKTESYKFNIQMIIKNLLPDRLENIDFDLAIITKKDLINPKDKLDLIDNYIEELNLSYKVNLTIYCTPADEPHDRDIITNYFKLHSGHSLDFFNNKGTINKDTTLHIVGLNGQVNNPHNLILQNFINVASRGKMDFDMFGYGKHRLLN